MAGQNPHNLSSDATSSNNLIAQFFIQYIVRLSTAYEAEQRSNGELRQKLAHAWVANDLLRQYLNQACQSIWALESQLSSNSQTDSSTEPSYGDLADVQEARKVIESLEEKKSLLEVERSSMKLAYEEEIEKYKVTLLKAEGEITACQMKIEELEASATLLDISDGVGMGQSDYFSRV